MLYVCMSIAGSIPVIFCFLLWLFQRSAYDFHLGKRLLQSAIFFYLVPFQMVKYLLPDRAVSVLTIPIDINVRQDFQKIVEINPFLSSGDSIWIPKWISVFLLLWLSALGIFSVYQIVKYRIAIRNLLEQSRRITVEVEGKGTELLVNGKIHTPYTVGFVKQSIIVPESSLCHPCFHMFYRHEEQHRRNHDSLMKLICILIICVHWINPVAILLLFLYGVTAEYICDASATEGCTQEEKKNYARALIELSAEKEPLSMVWRNHLLGSGKLMRRRIDCVMKRKGFMKKGIAVLLTVVMMLASACTIFAYEPFKSTDKEVAEVASFVDYGEFSDTKEIVDCDFSNSDTVFVYEDGTQEAITADVSPYALCNHKMKSGYYHAHKLHSSGGCTLYVYYAEICTKCGYLDLGDLYSTHTYAVCPHD